MKSLFQAEDRAELTRRVQALQADAPRMWGKMTVGQMLVHCQKPLQVAVGELTLQRNLLGVLFGRLVKKMVVGPKPFARNGPTAPDFVVKGEPDFATEKKGLVDLIEKFADRGPSGLADKHPFFGPMSTQDWDILQWKHLDHHLRQFGG